MKQNDPIVPKWFNWAVVLHCAFIWQSMPNVISAESYYSCKENIPDMS
jgi:hypothetical protein